MERRKVTTPKQFFLKERNEGYSNWTLSFWRELFQNSVDAGARNIDIRIETAKPRGSFDQSAHDVPEVVRVVFTDDGRGMSKDVLENVYFTVGATTKGDGNSIGGFGRARLMTCFANQRYSILTTDQFVIGDGAEWVSYDLDGAIPQIESSIGRLSGEESDRTRQAIDGLRSDLEIVTAARADGGFKGCRVEVYLDPKSGDWSNNHPTETRMLDQLRTYLSESQLAPKVTINGQSPEEFFKITDGSRLQARRGPALDSLTAVIDGETKEFATVHTSGGEKAAHKGKLIVRVDGASMYVNKIEIDKQVIVEVDQKMSRQVLTANRDGFKDQFDEALKGLLKSLVVNPKSALKDKKHERVTVIGEKGRIQAKRPSFEDISRAKMSEAEVIYTRLTERPARVVPANRAQLADFGLPLESIESFIRDFRYGESFVNEKMWDYDFPHSQAFSSFREAFYDVKWGEEVSVFFEKLPEDARGWVLDILKGRYQQELARVAEAHVKRDVIADMNDIVIHVENTNPVVRAAMRRNDPRNWDIASGKGRQPRALLVAWTEACSVAVETLMRVRPSVKDFVWTTGWCYDTPKYTDQGDRTREHVTEALHLSEGDKHSFLVNPVTEDGRLAYSPSDADDRQSLQALAMHEVAHVVASWHDETYANILTDIMKSYDFKEANRRMRDAVKAVYAAYDKGKARVQAMDSEPGPRPADRLLASAAPAAYRNDALDEAITHSDDGTRVIDCDALGCLELEQSPTFSRDEDYQVRYA